MLGGETQAGGEAEVALGRRGWEGAGVTLILVLGLGPVATDPIPGCLSHFVALGFLRGP